MAGLFALLPSISLAAESPSFRIERGDVRVTVPLMPGGAFEATTASLSGALVPGTGRPLPLAGEIAVDLASIDTGIALRNQHLRDKYLEVAKGPGFDTAVLSEVRLRDAEAEGFRGRTAFSGSLLLHGVKRAVSGSVEIRNQGAGVRVQASFPLALTDFGIEPPQYLGVGVASKIMVRVQFIATPGSEDGP